MTRADEISPGELVIVGADVDRWGDPIRPAGFGLVKGSSKDTGGAWAMFESPVASRIGVGIPSLPPIHIIIRRILG